MSELKLKHKLFSNILQNETVIFNTSLQYQKDVILTFILY